MAKVKYPSSQSMALKREALDILDEIARDLGGVSRRAAVEVLLRFLKTVRDNRRTTYSSLLLKDQLPE